MEFHWLQRSAALLRRVPRKRLASPVQPAEASPSRYSIVVADNFHYMDEDEDCQTGQFDDYETAVSSCKAIVDRFLTSHHRSGMTAEELYSTYRAFGEDPFIFPSPPGKHFSAWTYAKQRCEEVCGSTRPA